MTTIPFYNTELFYKKHKKEIDRISRSVFTHGKLLNGKEIGLLEERIAALCKRKYAVTTGSCTDALFFALNAYGITKGDKILVPSHSFIASATPVLRAGAMPVFSNTTNDFQMSLQKIDDKTWKSLKGIVLTHLFGNMADTRYLENIRKKYPHLVIIEDAAQALGCSNGHTTAGSFGDVSCISFDPSKVVHAFATGGILLTDEKEVADKARQLAHQGKTKDDDYTILGYNSRLSALSAALLLFQLDFFEEILHQRKAVADRYFSLLSDIEEISLPKFSKVSNYHKFVILCKKRDELKKYLADKGIETLIHYKKPLPFYSVFDKTNKENFSDEQALSKKALSLPIYPELSESKTEYICKTIRKFYKK